jgi:hypothetical protein
MKKKESVRLDAVDYSNLNRGINYILNAEGKRIQANKKSSLIDEKL